MSLNTAHASGGVLIYSGERILIYHDGVEASFDMTCGMPHFKGTKKGRIYLTTHRVIFNSKDAKDTLQSFAMPFYCMRKVELEQPIFGANYIKGQVRPENNGNWTGEGKFKLVFKDGGAIEFGQAMLQAGRLATRHMPQAPPPYTPPSGPYYQAPPPAYAPPTGPQYGFVPYQTFPNAPPANSVYMTEAPPPYPGVDGTAMAYPPPPPQNTGVPAYPPTYPPQQANGGQYPPYPPQQANGGQYPPYPPQQPNGAMGMSGQDAKAAEAAQSAYYNPANPHNVYMPQQYPGAPPAYNPGYAAPPPYTDYNKKDQ